MERLYGLLLGEEPSDESRLRAAMAAASIGGAVAHPLVADLDDDTDLDVIVSNEDDASLSLL